LEFLKVTIHPLFFAVIIFCAFFGGLLTTLIFVLTALLHECGHIFCAAKMGYSCKRIALMPYGAAAVCDIEGITLKDEIKLALAGPAVNAFICVFVAGLWWFFPVTYAYTDVILYASLAMLSVNLLPAYPLDGGRVASCIFQKFLKPKTVNIVLRVASVAIAAVFITLFFLFGYNLTCLFFALFLLCSALEKPVQAVKLNFSSVGRLKRGMEIKYVLADETLNFKDALKLLDERKYLVLRLYSSGRVIKEVTQDELYERIATCGIYEKVFASQGDSNNDK
jgi:stage IV sporulation protein FB